MIEHLVNGNKQVIVQDQLGRALHDLRISVIDRCNFRCPYCMPDEQYHHAYEFLDKGEWLTFSEIERLVRIFVQLGVEKVRLTGGEPLLRPYIHELVSRLSSIEQVQDMAMTTNGSLLVDKALLLRQAGLKRLTISLDSLDPHVFKQMSGSRGDVFQVLNGLVAARAAGFEVIKINTVVLRGVNDHTILDLVRFIRQEGHILRFIEYMDVGNQNHWDPRQVVPSREIVERIQAVFSLEFVGGTEDGETSHRYRFIDGQGEIGFVSSVTQPFCGTCNRLRLSADGKIYTCLFANQGIDLRGLLRQGASDQDLLDKIASVWFLRGNRYSELRTKIVPGKLHQHKIEMFQIGG